jgi:phenylpropionate dioxygenase-like ring-hydroxylating dioxygenase large terminal subunit
MFLKNCWYVAAWSHEIGETNLLARRILGEPLVLFRLENGTVTALVDRCPHRHAPLSKGRLENHQLRCMYHGLLFDGTGRCVEIPAQDRIGGYLKARSFPVIERDKYIWIWMGEAALADPSKIPDAHWQDDAEWRYKPGYIHYPSASYQLIMDNLLDFSHLGFVHENTLGGGRASAEVNAAIEKFDWGLRITRKYGNVPQPGFVKAFIAFEGLCDRWQIYEWRIAGNMLIMNSGLAPAGSGALDGHIVPQACVLQSVQSLTPETERSTHYFYMQAHESKANNPAIADELHRQLGIAFAEDKAIIEAQQKVIDEFPNEPFGGIAADFALNQGRALLQRMLDAERGVSAQAVERADA